MCVSTWKVGNTVALHKIVGYNFILCALCLPSEMHVSAIEDDFTGVPLW